LEELPQVKWRVIVVDQVPSKVRKAGPSKIRRRLQTCQQEFQQEFQQLKIVEFVCEKLH
jgi:hypothetical protein